MKPLTTLYALLLALAFGLPTTTVFAQDAGTPAPNTAPPTTPSTRLRVLAAGSPPFVIGEGSDLDGIAPRIWRSVADRARFTYDIARAPSVVDGINAVAAGRADILVGGISITSERVARVRFTLPYYQSSVSILAMVQPRTAFSRIEPFMSRSFVAAVGVLVLVLFGLGVLFWLVERRRNEAQFPRSPLAGIGNGMWLAVVTMTTVGYGDRAPVTATGRILAGTWMVLALILTSSLTAGIASALTVSQLEQANISTAEQLRGHRVAVIRGAPAGRLVRRYMGQPVEAENIDAAADLLAHGRAEALVHDRPILQHLMQRRADLRVLLSQARYTPQGYGFALSPMSPHLHTLNLTMLQLSETGELGRIVEEYLGRSEE